MPAASSKTCPSASIMAVAAIALPRSRGAAVTAVPCLLAGHPTIQAEELQCAVLAEGAIIGAPVPGGLAPWVALRTTHRRAQQLAAQPSLVEALDEAPAPSILLAQAGEPGVE